jgi:hypothetical protein
MSLGVGDEVRGRCHVRHGLLFTCAAGSDHDPCVRRCLDDMFPCAAPKSSQNANSSFSNFSRLFNSTDVRLGLGRGVVAEKTSVALHISQASDITHCSS